MNTCPDLSRLLAFAAGDLRAAAARQTAEHIGRCPACHRRLQDAAGIGGLLQISRWVWPMESRPDCPAEEHLLAFVDGSLTLEDRRGLEEHLSRCASCVSQISEMFAAVTERLNGDASPELAGRKAFVEALFELFEPPSPKPSLSPHRQVGSRLRPILIALGGVAVTLLVTLPIIFWQVRSKSSASALNAFKERVSQQDAHIADIERRFARLQTFTANLGTIQRYATARASTATGFARTAWNSGVEYLTTGPLTESATRGSSDTPDDAQRAQAVESIAATLASYAAGRLAEAKGLALKATETDPNDPVAWLVLADILRDLGDRPGADLALRRAQSANISPK